MPHDSASVQKWLGYLFVDELQALKTLANDLPKNPVVVNIGAGGGTSGLAFKESRPDLMLYTIDIQDESSPFGCLEGERIVMQDAGYVLGTGWEQIHGDSVKVGKTWRKPVDMVFIDGNHSYRGCTEDIYAWRSHIRAGGILAVHDYKKADADWSDNNKKPHPIPWPGVDRAVDELLIGKYPTVLHVDTLIAFRL